MAPFWWEGVERKHALYFSTSHTAPSEYLLLAKRHAAFWECWEEQNTFGSWQANSLSQHVHKSSQLVRNKLE